MLALTIREKNGEERQLIFEKEEVTIGRATGSDIVLPRNNISKRHARLVDKHDKVVIVDLRSTNGTYVNGRRITAPELLTYEDKVYIGDFVIRLSRPAEQHPSQKMTAPYSASPTPAEPRTARAATAAVDPHMPPPLDDSDFMSEEPLPARVASLPPAPPVAPDEDESTRAIAAMPDDDDFPPPPKPKIEAPKPTPPKPKAPAPAAAAPVAPLPPTPPTPPAPTAPPMPVAAAPKPAPRAARPPSEDPPTMVPTSRDPGLTPVVKKAAAALPPTPPAPPAPPPQAEPEDDESATGELDGAQSWNEDGGAGYDPWAEWNAAIEAVVVRIEADAPDAASLAALLDDAVGVATRGVDEAIESGAIAADTDRAALVEDVVLELTAGGPLAELLSDPTVHMIALNGPKSIHVARAPMPAPLEVNGRLFASTRSYRRALAQLSGRDEEVIADLVGLDEHRLANGAVLRLIGSGNSTPHSVLLRPVSDVPLLPDLVADRLLDQAQAQTLTQAIAAGLSIAVVGPSGPARAMLASALAAEHGLDRRVAVIGDGTRLALPQADVARITSSALMSGGHLVALEADFIAFERVDLHVGNDWVEASLSAGVPTLTLLDGPSADKALRRLSLIVEMATGLEGRGAALVGECIDVVVTLAKSADGSAKVEKVLDVESQKDGYTLKAPTRR